MRTNTSDRPSVPSYVHVVVMLPFAMPIILTFLLILLVGDHWPRDIAAGSGLKLVGLLCAAVTATFMWLYTVRNIFDPRIRTFTALLCAVTGLLGWPIWSTGILPSVNGAVLAEPVVVPMTLERTETTYKSKSRDLYHWAWLKAQNEAGIVKSGRYFISEDVYARYHGAEGGIVEVTVAKGLLGAQVVLGFD